jgi:hypothetical protein
MTSGIRTNISLEYTGVNQNVNKLSVIARIKGANCLRSLSAVATEVATLEE